jgi:hypothetical protein
MQDLRVIGVEDGALVVVSDAGERFRIPVDDTLKSTVRHASPERGGDRRLSPREIQVLIRGGQSAEQVASSTGVSLEYVQRFEGPVLAEREYVVDSARGVAVHTALDDDPEGATFGDVISERLETMSAVDERWSSWKEEGAGWIVAVTFTADEVEHDARWQFDPKRSALSPMNAEAIRLSQQGDASSTLIPRLRVVGGDRSTDTSRFDSGAFMVDDPAFEDADVAPRTLEPEPEVDRNQTADLLEALRRRRGEREPALYADEEQPAPASDHPSTGIRIVDVPLDGYFDDGSLEPESPQPDAVESPAPQQTTVIKPARKGRAAMPSWDDIVFGTKPDDDMA